MAGGPTRKISAASARAHTRKAKQESSIPSGIFAKILLVVLTGFLAWGYQATRPPPPKTCGSPDGPPVTAPRIKLSDGRHLAYKEFGVPRENAKYKIVYIHGYDGCRHDVPISILSQDVIEIGVYIVSFDRPGYGESDPNPKRTVKSLAFDIQELADQLRLGSKFYVMGFSMGGQAVWTCLRYIPHRLAGAALIAPVVNYWWPKLPSNMSQEAFNLRLPQDQWTLRIAHYFPWLTYWWNSQKFFPACSAAGRNPAVFSSKDLEIISKGSSSQDYRDDSLHTNGIMPRDDDAYMRERTPFWLEHYRDAISLAWQWALMAQVRQQGQYESLHRDLMISFGTWEFDPMDLENPFPKNEGSVHLWQGDEDKLSPVTLQRYIAEQLPWIQYHEISGAGHLVPMFDGMGEKIIKALLTA
ncbi:hypothetical protein RND71_031132 [Anisodus tanguticus]|uniref:AB hydrolase-1 domain-containing protein n=1 Tax=Anisodus tanguticus TaxID=243964 RepID=A0AAE1RD31_9SOLA|nr:hypothetical protein RND71_031132 [Anisodus tanguticus]